MEKADSSREVSKWETLDIDILAFIFDKLDVIDITMGASRVCVYWYLASHNKTLWNTVDLAKLQQKGQPILLYKHQVDDEVKEFTLTKITSRFFSDVYVEGISLRSLLFEISKLSGTVPKNLFFNFYSCIQEMDLMFAAKRMKNIEKLVLPVWCYQTENSFRFAFSQWKTLKTLIIAHDYYVTGTRFEFQDVGKNCSNLTNLKYLGNLHEHYAEEIVRYLQGLKRLSLQCSSVSITAVLSLITGLQKLTILNLSHCKELDLYPKTIHNDNLVQAATQKLEKLIICSGKDCKVCKDGPNIFGTQPFYEKNWRNDEIKELEF